MRDDVYINYSRWIIFYNKVCWRAFILIDFFWFEVNTQVFLFFYFSIYSIACRYWGVFQVVYRYLWWAFHFGSKRDLVIINRVGRSHFKMLMFFSWVVLIHQNRGFNCTTDLGVQMCSFWGVVVEVEGVFMHNYDLFFLFWRRWVDSEMSYFWWGLCFL